jgi:ATP adenylyltransferase
MHQSIWAPWRIDYIQQPKTNGCFLCRILQETNDRDNLLLKRSHAAAAVMNRYPYNGGHLMIVPYRHIANLEQLTPEEHTDITHLTTAALRIMKQTMRPDGFNIGYNLGSAAGAGLAEHLHQHIVPRWNADTNFMPVIGETHVMPQALLEQYDQLKPHFDRLTAN